VWAALRRMRRRLATVLLVVIGLLFLGVLVGTIK
jgi:hypothetical protein